MKNFTRYSALFLLLLFVRVMTPDVLLLRLHAHEHTQDSHPAAKHQVGTKHHHCAIDNLFQAPFQPTESLELPTPLVQVTEHRAHLTFLGFVVTLNRSFLRGPPASSFLSYLTSYGVAFACKRKNFRF